MRRSSRPPGVVVADVADPLRDRGVDIARQARGSALDEAVGSQAEEPAANRWETWVIWTAILAPLPYTLSRIMWAVGIPVGFSEEGLREYDIPGWGSVTVLALALLCEATAVFVHAFVLPPARTLPNWIPIARGKPVRPGMVIAVLIVPIVILAYANTISVASLLGLVAGPETGAHNTGWATTWLTGLTFGVWGPALTATVLYAWRRQRSRGRRTLTGDEILG